MDTDLDGVTYEVTITPSDARGLNPDDEITLYWSADERVDFETEVVVHVDGSEDGGHKVTDSLE